MTVDQFILAVIGGFIGGLIVITPTVVQVAREIYHHGWRNDR